MKGVEVRMLTKIIHIWDKFLDSLSKLSIIFFLLFILIAIVEVFRRYVLGQSFVWQQDIVTYGILCAVYLYFSITQHARANVEVQIFVDQLSKGGGIKHKIAEFLRGTAIVLNMIFVSIMIWFGLPWANAYRCDKLLVSCQIMPIWPFVWLFIFGMVLLLITLFVQLFKNIVKIN